MPHSRVRFLISLVLKKLKYSPVLAIQGARQTGKSFFTREILAKQLANARYISFDQDSVAKLAHSDIESFLARYEGEEPLMVDEAQKVPAIFDAVKFTVDTDRRPGRFLLLGSTEFSKLTLIRESLTGRVTRVRFYPFTIAESHQLKNNNTNKAPFYLSSAPRISRKEFLLSLERGGMPGIFSIRDESERHSAFKDWVELTVHRDIHQFPKLRLDPTLCLKILQEICTLDAPTASAIAHSLEVDLRRIKTHLQCLEALFAITPIPPHRSSTGAPLYYILDEGIATFLNATRLRQIETLFVKEYFAKQGFNDNQSLGRQLYYYRTTKGVRVSFVEETSEVIRAIQILAEPTTDRRKFYALTHFREKQLKGRKLRTELYILSPTNAIPIPKGGRVFLWEQLA